MLAGKTESPFRALYPQAIEHALERHPCYIGTVKWQGRLSRARGSFPLGVIEVAACVRAEPLKHGEGQKRSNPARQTANAGRARQQHQCERQRASVPIGCLSHWLKAWVLWTSPWGGVPPSRCGGGPGRLPVRVPSGVFNLMWALFVDAWSENNGHRALHWGNERYLVCKLNLERLGYAKMMRVSGHRMIATKGSGELRCERRPVRSGSAPRGKRPL